MKNKVLVVIPAYNESSNIQNVIKDIKSNIKYVDILVINDCSTDSTLDVVKKNKVKCISNLFNSGYAWTLQTGIKYAYYHNYDYVIQMDGDGQHLAKEINTLFKYAKSYDIILGSRYLKDMGYKSPLFRRIGTKVFNLLIKLFTGKSIKDPLSGFQCINKRVIEYYSKYDNYPEYPDAGLIIEMLLNGYSIKEVPVKMKNREYGKSMHSGILNPIKYMIKQFYTCVVIMVKYIGKRRIK